MSTEYGGMKSPMNADRAFFGSFAKLLKDGEWMTNVHSIEAVVEMEKGELSIMGDNWTRHKRGQMTGTGSITEYKVTSDMIEQGFERFELIISLEDPEAHGHERVRLMNCMVDAIQLAGVTAGEIIEYETPFTFEGFELLDAVHAD